MHKCDFTGRGEIRRVKNGFNFHFRKDAALTHHRCGTWTREIDLRVRREAA